MIEYVPQAMEEIDEVVRSIPRVQQRTVEQIVHVPVPRVVEEIAEVVQTIPRGVSQSRSSTVGVPVAMQRQVPIIQTVRKTVKVLRVQFLD